MTKEIFLNRYNISNKQFSEEEKQKNVNKIFGNLKVLDIIYATSKSNPYNNIAIAECLCLLCNNKFYTHFISIKNGNTISCGCKKWMKMCAGMINASKKQYIGKLYKTNEGYTIQIIDMINTHNVKIKFLNVDKEYETFNTMQNIKNGQIKYPYNINSYGGYYGVGPYTARLDGVKTQEYVLWMGMLYRCNTSIGYKDTKVCNEWLNFQNFAKWYNENKYECKLPLEIDKDILSYFEKGIKYYSPNSCILIPMQLNRSLSGILNMTYKDVLKLINRFKSFIPIEILNRIKLYYKNAK